ncbi:MAG: hypothetical protein ACYTE8_03455, partial [Planctomycetota bacterium]
LPFRQLYLVTEPGRLVTEQNGKTPKILKAFIHCYNQFYLVLETRTYALERPSYAVILCS